MRTFFGKNRLAVFALCTICFAASCLAAGCSAVQQGPGAEESYSKSGMYFDTVITIKLYGSKAETSAWFDGCFTLADEYEKKLSNQIEDSEISKVNHAGGKYVEISEDTAEILKTACSYCKDTKGCFDITVGGLERLWNFQAKNPAVPKQEDIDAELEKVHYQQIRLRETDGKFFAAAKNGSEIDLGGIAKGFIADKMKAYLLAQGARSGIINLGGNVLLIGSKPGGAPYKVGIQKPFDDLGNPAFFVKETGDGGKGSIVTSGTYQRYFEADGRRYHHILDTKTGYPVDNGLSSVTIFSERSIDGDALSTAVFCLGETDGMAYVEKLDGVEAVFIREDGSIRGTSGAVYELE